jgi:hypothetical protein
LIISTLQKLYTFNTLTPKVFIDQGFVVVELDIPAVISQESYYKNNRCPLRKRQIFGSKTNS